MIILSHKLNVKTPAFNNGPSLTITPIKEIRTGGSSNSYMLSLQNHLGTHIDAPNHFSKDGRPLASYPIDNFIFDKPYLIDLPKQDSELVTKADLETYRDSIREADLLLLRTGFQIFRETDPLKYGSQNPGLSAEAARYITENFGNLRALGLDSVSLSPVQNRAEGRQAHRNLLNGRNFFIIEDMDLQSYQDNFRRVVVVPLYVEGVDSAPCTVIAEI